MINQLLSGTRAAGAPGSRFLALLAATAVLTGCGLTSNQRSGIATFTASTTTLADGMAESFVKTRDDLIELRSSMLELGSGSVRLADPAADLDGPLNVDQVELRLKSAVALQRFAELLDALTSDTQGPRIQAAADRFLGGLTGIEGVNLPPDKANAIAAVVTKVGGLWVEHKRKVAVKKVVAETQPVIRRLVELIAEDFDPGKLFWVGALSATQHSITNTLADQSQEVIAGQPLGEDEDGPKWTEAGAALWHARYEALTIEAGRRLDTTARTSAKVREALDRFGQAHDELVALMQAPDFEIGRLQDYAVEVEELARLIKILTTHGDE